MTKRIPTVLAAAVLAAAGFAFAGSALAECGASHQSVSLPTTTAQSGPVSTTPAPQPSQTGG